MKPWLLQVIYIDSRAGKYERGFDTEEAANSAFSTEKARIAQGGIFEVRLFGPDSVTRATVGPGRQLPAHEPS
jgi:hypothetical protein